MQSGSGEPSPSSKSHFGSAVPIRCCAGPGADVSGRLLPQPHGFEGLLLGAKGCPPAQLAVSRLHALPHRLLNRHSAQHAGHPEVQNTALRTTAKVEQLPCHALERAANSLPPSVDAVVATKGGSFDLGDQRRELHVLGHHRDQCIQIPAVDRPQRRFRDRARLRVLLRHQLLPKPHGYLPHPSYALAWPSTSNQYSRKSLQRPSGASRTTKQPAIVAVSLPRVAVTQNSAATRSPPITGDPIRTLTSPCSAASFRM